MKTEYGVHTFCLTVPKLSYQKLQDIADNAYDMKFQTEHLSDKYHLDHTYRLEQYAEQGIRLELHQFCAHAGFIKLILAPGSLLSETYNPLRLYRGESGEWKGIQRRYKELFPIPGLPKSLNNCSLSRTDLTWDFYPDSQEEVAEWVRVIKKSMRSSQYKLREFTKKSGGIKNSGEANRHSCEYCTATRRKNKKAAREYGIQPQTAFKAYDKQYETRNRMTLKNPVLRLELSLSRQSLTGKLNVKNGVGNRGLLDTAAGNAPELICYK